MRGVSCGSLLILALAVPAAAQSPAEFTWTGTVAAGKTIQVKGVNGEVRAELGTGTQVEVRATKRARRGDVADVRIETVEDDGNVTICAVYPASMRRNYGRRGDGGERRPNECRVGDAGYISSHDSDVAVDFLVRVPAGVRFDGRTINGRIDARGLRGDAYVRTVNGRIDLSTSGSGSAQTVNGSIDAALGSAAWQTPLVFKSVNGSITLRLPKDTNTNVRAKSMSGRFESDFPITVQQFQGRNRRVEGVIGSGGRDLELKTVNGGISLRFVTP